MKNFPSAALGTGNINYSQNVELDFEDKSAFIIPVGGDINIDATNLSNIQKPLIFCKLSVNSVINLSNKFVPINNTPSIPSNAGDTFFLECKVVDNVIYYEVKPKLFEYLNFTRYLSEDQDFIVSDDSPDGEYVGIVKAYPEFEKIGTTPTFTLKTNDSNIYAVSSTGQISIADNTSLAVGSDTITVTVTKGSKTNDIDITINVLNNTLCTFIDPDLGSDGTGTRIDPRNVLPTFVDNTIALLKRGTTLLRTGLVYIDNIDNILIAGYGTGTLPKIEAATLNPTDGGTIFRIYSNISEGHLNNTIRDLEISSTAAAIATPGTLYDEWLGTLCNVSNGAGTFRVVHNHIHHTQDGVIIRDSGTFVTENCEVDWNNIHDVAKESIFVKDVSDKCSMSCNVLERMNLRWFEDPDQTISSGDGIQTYDVHKPTAHHNYIDKSYTGNKFCIIFQYNNGTLDGLEWCEIHDNYLIGNLGGDPTVDEGNGLGISGAVVYADFTRGNITRNTMIGASRNAGAHCANSTSEVTISYNIFKNLGWGIQNNANPSAYNNTFYNCNYAATHITNDFKNNIIFFTEAGQIAYPGNSAIVADYNLFNIEQDGMFGVGYDNLASLTGKEVNGIIGDPVFEDVVNNIFKITASSIAYRTGVNIPLTLDFYSQSLNNPPCIGLHEI